MLSLVAKQTSYAQETRDLVVEWDGRQEIREGERILSMPVIRGQEPDNGKPVYFYRERLKSASYAASFDVLETELAPSEDVNYLKEVGFAVPGVPVIEVKVSTAGDQHYLVVYTVPYLKSGETLLRIKKIRVKLEPLQEPAHMEKNFASHSVLQTGSGSWYKIKVTQDGIYKIDKSFLESCGISTEGLNPDHINIFGNGDGRLPELNSVPRTDDLAKNAIQIIGDADGTFDDGDYILFYGWGPSRWYANGTSSFDQDKNIYVDHSAYFININPSETPLRISDLPVTASTPNLTVNSYSYRDVHELDLVSLVKGGQRWYGELFDTELERTFNFYVPNIVSTSPAQFKLALATNAKNSAGTLQTYSVGTTILESSSLPSVSADFVQINKALTLNNPSTTIPFKISITRNSPSMLTYLDRIVLNVRRSLVFSGQQMNFRDLNSIGTGNVSQFDISSLSTAGFVWDVTDRHNPKRIQGNHSGAFYSFVVETDTLREFVASNGTAFLSPERIGAVEFQDLHGLEQADYLIVTHSDFVSQANRLADLHRNNGMTVHVVTTDKIYNEFSGGVQDPVGIRMFVKMFYDRGASDPTTRPKYLLLFGDGTYDPKDRVSNNNNFVITYQVENSENHIASLVTDDFFGMLNDNEAIAAADMLDIGVGRLLISDIQMARQQVDKIEHYMKNGSTLFSGSQDVCLVGTGASTFGDWRLKYVQIADDEEGGYFINNDTEPQYEYVKANNPEMNCEKLYLDAFSQTSSAGGQRYPDVFEAITDRVEKGALLVNYVGHGGEVGLAEERVVTVPQIQSWDNIHKMNLFVSATCEFTKFDDPSRVSAGEWVSLNANGGAIALMTTTRSVFFGVNTITGKKFFENVFNRDADSLPKTFGEIIRLTKNASGSSDNKRSFTLIGDPALRIAHPVMRVVTDSINGMSPAIEIDTVRALSKVTVKGHLEDYFGNVLTGFDGVLSPSIFDKVKNYQTLAQDDDSPVISFEIQRNIVYKGKATVNDGYFEFSFIVPKDITFSYGPGKISYYANSTAFDAAGYDMRFVIGGIDTSGIDDANGPDIDLFMNNEQFVNGGITNETPVLIARIFDDNGVNTVGNGIGHDITAVLDGNSEDPIVLNEYYTSDLDSYQSGEVRYTLPQLTPGEHTLTLKVWDVNNNSSQATIEFVVQESEDVVLDHVLNYPNPFTTHTEFYFEHNQVCSELEVQLQVMTVAGRLVRTINQNVKTSGFRSDGIPWDGRDDFGDQLAKGVYVYVLKVRTPDGKVAEKTEKLVLLR